MADIRSFFGRKRKSSDSHNERTIGPVAKKRKICSQTATVTEDESDRKNNDKNTETADNESNDGQDAVPKIESLDIKTCGAKMDDADYDPSSDAKDGPMEDVDEYESMEEEQSDDDDDLHTNSHSVKHNKSTASTTTSASTSTSTATSTTSAALSKIKESSLKESIRFDVVKEAGFSGDKLMEYKVIADLFEKMATTTKRLEKIEMMSRVFRSILHLKGKDPKSLLYSVYLCCNEIAPPYDGIELGIGDSIILKALCESTGRKMRDIKSECTQTGDLGDVAVKCRSKQNTLFKPKPLTVVNVFETLKKIAMTSGSGTQQEKVRNIQRLFVAASGSEAKYICRHLQGKLRIGVNEQTVLAALGRALAFDRMAIFHRDKKQRRDYQKIADLEQEYTAKIKMAVAQLPSYEMMIGALIEYGIDELNVHCKLTPGIPIKVMLAKPTKGISEILQRFENIRFTLEYKYDGERAQIHLLPNGEIRIFSRNAENNTAKFPELVDTVNKFKNDGVSSFIIDSEIVAFDRENDTILPFATLITRKRKNVNAEDITVSVCIYAFDCLLVNGEPLIEKTFAERREALYKYFHAVHGEFCFAHHRDTDDPEEIAEYLNQAVGVGKCEGLMVKTLDVDATYEPSRRSHNWLKCKKDYLEGVGDTLDLVVMGAFHGTGKRTGTYGSYLVGCYNEEEDSYQSCCKVATGFKDEDLQSLDKEMKALLTAKEGTVKPMDYETSFECQVWFEPKAVWELKCADLTISPMHQAACGLAHEVKGIALRFPRYLNRREDKQPTDATTAQQIFEMYSSQAIFG